MRTKVQPRDERDLCGNSEVIWNGKKYVTGNRRLDEVELYKNGKFFRTVMIKDVYYYEYY